MSFTPITDSRTDRLINEIPGIKTYRYRSMCERCLTCICTPHQYCIHNMIFITMICSTGIYCGFGILYIWNNKRIIKSCNISHLWYYIMISTAHCAFRNIYQRCIKYDKNLTNTICCIGGFLTLELLLSLWGYIEVYVIPNISNINSTDININMTNINITACANLKHTEIWNFGVISVIVQFAITALLLTMTIYLTCKYYNVCYCF